jgi:hypothetical protein
MSRKLLCLVLLPLLIAPVFSYSEAYFVIFLYVLLFLSLLTRSGTTWKANSQRE